MDRSHEPRRGTTGPATSGLPRRRQRSSGLRDSPEEDVGIELQESMRFRERVIKKDRDRERDERDRASRSKRRRGEKFLHGSNREDAEESTEESVDEEEDGDDGAAIALRLQQINQPSSVVPASTSVPDHPLKRSFPAKNARSLGSWKVAEEIIGASIPRKARSASAKRSQECWVSGGGSNGAETIPRQASTSPARTCSMAAAPAAPMSPSSSSASVRKKMRPTGSKHRSPKVVSKTSAGTEIEFEIAEVLYGMTRQFHCPPKKEAVPSASHKHKPREENGSSNDTRPKESSPISTLPPAELPQSVPMEQNSNSMAVATRRKRPQPLKSEGEKSATCDIPEDSFSKIEGLREGKVEDCSSDLEKRVASSADDGHGTDELKISMTPSIAAENSEGIVKKESDPVPDPVPLPVAGFNGGLDATEGIEIASRVDRSPLAKMDADPGEEETVKQESGSSAGEAPREKIEIDMMIAPSGKSSPERDDTIAGQRSVLLDDIPNKEAVISEDGAVGNVEVAVEVGLTMKAEAIEDLDLQKPMVNDVNLDLQIDAEKLDSDDDKSQVQRQVTKATKNESKAEKTAQSASSPLAMTIAGWPGALPSMGYIGKIPPSFPALPMDIATGSATAVQPPNFLLPRPRPKKCATHFYIAQTISYLRQVARMSASFWPGAAGFAPPPYGNKPCNLSVFSGAESATLGSPMQSGLAGKNLCSLQDKDLGDEAFNEIKSSALTFMDSSQKKLPMAQHASPSPPKNMLQAPTFLLSPNQPQPTPSAASGSVKSTAATGKSASSSSASVSALGSATNSGYAPGTGAPVTFNQAELPAYKAQYMAMMLQTNGYPFPMPAQVGGPSLYRGGHRPPVPVPLLNGSFFANQMLHPSQVLQPHIQALPPSVQMGNQNSSAATTSVSNSSQKHLQQQQQSQECPGNCGSRSAATSSGFPAMNQCPLPLQHYLPSHLQYECEIDNGDNRSSGDSRVSNSQKGGFSHDFVMPFHPQNFAILAPPAIAGGGSGGDKTHQQSLKGGVELNQSQAFAMSFAAFNNAAASPGLDFSSFAPNHGIFNVLSEAVRHNQAAASMSSSWTAQQKSHESGDERKPVIDSNNSNASAEEDRKMKMSEKAHTLSFSTPDSDHHSNPAIVGNSVGDRSKNMPAAVNSIRTPSRAGGDVLPPSATSGTTSLPSSSTPPANQKHLFQQLQQQQRHQQLQQQQRAVHCKSPLSNVSPNPHPDRTPVVGKFPNAASVFPQALAQGGVPTQFPQWKSVSTKAGTTATSEPSAPSARNLHQLQSCRTQMGATPSSGHTQISFGATAKPVLQQQFANGNASPSSFGVAGSPPPMSNIIGASGSPRTSTDSKSCPNPMPSSSQSAKSSMPSCSTSSRKSPPVNSQIVPPVAYSNVITAEVSGVKQQHQQLSKQPMLQHSPQPIFPNFYVQGQCPQSTSTSNHSGSHQKRQIDHQPQQQQPSALAASSSVMPSLSGSASSKAAAAAATSMKGLPSHGFLQAAQLAVQSAGSSNLLMPPVLSYIHSVPAAPVKSVEQKPAAA